MNTIVNTMIICILGALILGIVGTPVFAAGMCFAAISLILFDLARYVRTH